MAKDWKVSRAYFNRFKKAFISWQEKLGLVRYRIFFYMKDVGNNYARICINEESSTASAILNEYLSEDDLKFDDGPESHAKHEAIHLLISKLANMARCRYVSEAEIDDEVEAVVNTLEKVLK